MSEGQAHDLNGADVLLPQLSPDIKGLLADKSYDAEQRVLEPLKQAGIEAVIPPTTCRKNQRSYDKQMYKQRHRIENFFGKLKTYPVLFFFSHKFSPNNSVTHILVSLQIMLQLIVSLHTV